MKRLKRIALVAAPIIVFPAVFLYDIIRLFVDLDIHSVVLIRELLLAGAFLSVFLFFNNKFREFRSAPKEMGNVLFGLIFADLFLAVCMIFQKGGPGAAGATIRQTATDVFVTTVNAIIFICLSLFLIKILRELILQKRKKSSQLYFRLYLIGLLIVSVDRLLDVHENYRALGWMISAILIVLICINSFKQNWIVYLSKREKMYTLAYSALLFIGLLGNCIYFSRDSSSGNILKMYSVLLQQFFQWNFVFGTIYFGIAFTSTLFHLPTAEVFERKQSELNSLRSLSRLITQIFDFDELMATVIQMTIEVSGAKSAWLEVLEYDEKLHATSSRVVTRKNISQTHIDVLAKAIHAIADGQDGDRHEVVRIDDIWTDKRTKHLKNKDFPRISMISIPLISHDVSIGVLHVVKDAADRFEKDDIELLTTFADNVSLAIDNSKLIEKSIERERLQQEMLLAQQMQKRLFPEIMPSYDTMELAAFSESSFEVGGDYYDVVNLPHGRIGIIIGDVAGKGVSAAFYMAEMKGIFLSLSTLCESPKEFFIRANAALLKSIDKKSFVSLEYTMLDTARGSLILARAGHCPALFVRQGKAEFLRPDGMGLGLTGMDVFAQSMKECEILLQPGDICVFYTDGISEAQNMAGDEYGTDRLVEIVLNSQACQANEIQEKIITSVKTFMDVAAYKDDMTLIVLKWKGNSRV